MHARHWTLTALDCWISDNLGLAVVDLVGGLAGDLVGRLVVGRVDAGGEKLLWSRGTDELRIEAVPPKVRWTDGRCGAGGA
jgi:hypothetical protein